MKPTALISLLLLALLAACGTTNPGPGPVTPPPPPVAPPPPPSPTPPPPPANTLNFQVAAQLPKGISDLEQDLSPLVVELVEIASDKKGALTLVGTLTQSGNTFNYSATPTNQLKVVWSDGAIYEFVFSKFEGNLSGTAKTFYKNNHLLTYTAKFKPDNTLGNVNLSIQSQRQGINLVVKIGGTVVFEGANHTLGLDYAQQLISDFGPGSIEFHHADTLKGSISGPSVQIQINESYDFKLVGSNSLVLQTIRNFNNSWTEAGQPFKLQNGLIKKVFRDGKPIEADFWTAQGDLLKGGVKVGGLGQAFTGNILEFFLDTPNGRVRLEAHEF